MAEHAGSKVLLMLPLDFGHLQKTVYELRAPGTRRKTRRDLVLLDVAPLKFSGAVHRREPARQVTERAQRAANQESLRFPYATWLSTKLREYVSYKAAMMPLFIFNLTNPRLSQFITD